MIYGAVAAFAWGFADLCAAYAVRRFGFLRVLTVSQLTALASFTVVLVVASPDLGDPNALDISLLFLLGILMTTGYVAFYRALELGPVAVVAPVVASYAVVPAILGPVFLDDTMTLVLVMCVVSLIGGLALTQFSGAPRVTGSRTGVQLAVVAVALIGLIAVALAYFARELGWFVPLFVLRCGTTTTLLLARGRSRTREPITGVSLLLASAAVGILDNIGFAFYARGSEVSAVSVVAAVSALHPLVPVVGALVIFQERLRPRQLTGIVVVIAALVALGIAE